MISFNYQEEERGKIKPVKSPEFAIVTGIDDTGLQLMFDGEVSPTNKRYKFNSGYSFNIGDRVKVNKQSGSYVVEFPLGKAQYTSAPGNVTNLSFVVGETDVSISWADPDDTIIDGQVVSKWKGTYLVKNENHTPLNETDGILLLTNQVKDAYKNVYFVDSNLISGKTYYYALFPYSEENKVNKNEENTFSATPEKVIKYGVKIDTNNSDPNTAVEYIYDAAGKKPAKINLETGEFDYGDWADVEFIKDCRPCMLKYDGSVDYYLNPNDYSKKEDGSPSDISNIDYKGNAMVEFPLWYVTMYNEDGYDYLILTKKKNGSNSNAYAFMKENQEIASKMYLSMFPACKGTYMNYSSFDKISYHKTSYFMGSEGTSQQGCYYPLAWSEFDYISSLLIILSKSLNLSESFGYGPKTRDNVENTVCSMFYGRSKETDDTINIFHMKNWWGDPYFIAGIAEATNRYPEYGIDFALKRYPPYTEARYQSGYNEKCSTGIKETSGKYLKKTSFNAKYGKVPRDCNGSETTFYCSYNNTPPERTFETFTNLFVAGYRETNGFGLQKHDNEKYCIRLSCHP